MMEELTIGHFSSQKNIRERKNERAKLLLEKSLTYYALIDFPTFDYVPTDV